MVPTNRIAGFGLRPQSMGAMDRAPASGAASLEQLRSCSRELEGGIFLVETEGCRCLFDPGHARFGRVQPGSACDADLMVVQWHPYDRVFRDGRDVVIVPSADAIRIRIRPKPRTEECAAPAYEPRGPEPGGVRAHRSH